MCSSGGPKWSPRSEISFPRRNFDINKLQGDDVELTRTHNMMQDFNNKNHSVHVFRRNGNYHVLTINHDNKQFKNILVDVPAKHVQYSLHRELLTPFGSPYNILGVWDNQGNLSLNKDQDYTYVATGMPNGIAWLLTRNNNLLNNQYVPMMNKLRDYLSKQGFKFVNELNYDNYISSLNNNSNLSTSLGICHSSNASSVSDGI